MTHSCIALIQIAVVTTFTATCTFADAPQIVDAKARKNGDSWSFDVTILHGDTGWEHYADGWRVVDTNGAELGLRTLFHPHENEQPFTRSLSGVSIPAGVNAVFIQARDNVDGWAGPLFEIKLPK